MFSIVISNSGNHFRNLNGSALFNLHRNGCELLSFGQAKEIGLQPAIRVG